MRLSPLRKRLLSNILTGMERTRNPGQTRQIILQAAFDSFHAQGFQASSLNNILTATGMTKGALYHYFPDKLTLGYAVVDEILKDYVERWWLQPLQDTDDPVESLAQLIQERLSDQVPGIVHLGCPLNNLVQEMALVDREFRRRLEGLYRLWRKGLSSALRHGQQTGRVRSEVDTESAAAFIIATIEGAFGQAKAAQSLDVFQKCMSGLSRYLSSLRP